MITTNLNEVNFLSISLAEEAPVLLEYLPWSTYMVGKLYRRPPEDTPRPTNDGAGAFRLPIQRMDRDVTTTDPNFLTRCILTWVDAVLTRCTKPTVPSASIAPYVITAQEDLGLQYHVSPTHVILAIPEEHIIQIRGFLPVDQFYSLCTTLDLRLPKRFATPPSLRARELMQQFITGLYRTSTTLMYRSQQQIRDESALQNLVGGLPAFAGMFRRKLDLTEYHTVVRAWMDRFAGTRRAITAPWAAKYLGVGEAYGKIGK